MTLVFVDCEASGPCPGMGELTEFGAVIYKTKKTFYGDMRMKTTFGRTLTMRYFLDWLQENCESRPVFVSDNPAFDWQWINYWFHHTLGMNPFGWSARRIGDYYAGLKGNFHRSAFEEMELQREKKLAIAKQSKLIDDIFITTSPMDTVSGTEDYEIPRGVHIE